MICFIWGSRSPLTLPYPESEFAILDGFGNVVVVWDLIYVLVS